MKLLAVLSGILVFVLIISYACFLRAFWAIRRRKKTSEEYPIPPGKIYEPYRDKMTEWMKEVRAMPSQEFSIRSFDGLTLYGRYYECRRGAPVEIMFHGYRGSAERDLCGGVQRAFSLGRNVLLVDQRTSGKSGGRVISFGINESRDCLAWVDFAVKHFGDDVRIILTGISMGAATVCIAAGETLPKNVVGVLADCGYSSPKAIIQKVIADMKLPPRLAYPFVKLGAYLFGRFDLESKSPVESLKNAKVPIIFFHGDCDNFVPCEMSRQNYDVCTCPKRLVTVKGAGHGMAYLIDPENYLKEVADFFTENGLETLVINKK